MLWLAWFKTEKGRESCIWLKWTSWWRQQQKPVIHWMFLMILFRTQKICLLLRRTGSSRMRRRHRTSTHRWRSRISTRPPRSLQQEVKLHSWLFPFSLSCWSSYRNELVWCLCSMHNSLGFTVNYFSCTLYWHKITEASWFHTKVVKSTFSQRSTSDWL